MDPSTQSLTRAPSPFVMQFLEGVPAGGTILDIACGTGRHLRAALARGYRLSGIDRDLSGLADLAGLEGVELIESDLETGQRPVFAGRLFDGVIVTNYLWRPILPDIFAAVAPAGLLIYETFAQGNERYGKPSHPAHLLRPGELIDALRPAGADLLTPIAYEQAKIARGGQLRIVQRLCAVGAGHHWLDDPPGSLLAP